MSKKLALLLAALTFAAPLTAKEKPTPERDLRSAILLNEDGGQDGVIHYEMVNGIAITQGDIALYVDDRGYASFHRETLDPHSKAATRTNRKWSNGIVYYQKDSNLSSTWKTRIDDAIAEWQSKTSLTFVEDSSANSRIYFSNQSGCSSPIGRQGGRQDVFITNCAGGYGAVLHEIGHSIGLYHEQMRPDRDSFITINWSNIESGKASNFTMQLSTIATDTPYDYFSIMHYGCWHFSTGSWFDPADRTIIPDDPSVSCSNMGEINRQSLSPLDALGVELNYTDSVLICPACPYTTIQDALDDGWDKITLDPGDYYENLNIDYDVTISGADAANPAQIRGSSSDRVVNINGPYTVHLQDLFVRNGSATNGAGIRCNGCDLTLDDVEIKYNHATKDAGGLFVHGNGTLTMTGGKLYSNTSANGFDGGGARILNSTASFTDVNFSSNDAGSSSKGGALRAVGSTVYLYDCKLSTSNHATSGAAVSTKTGTTYFHGTQINDTCHQGSSGNHVDWNGNSGSHSASCF